MPNYSHNKVKKLPPALRSQVDNKLLNGETLEEVTSYLKESGADISRSSLGRYALPFRRQFEEARAFREYARCLVEDNIERPSTELLEATNLLLTKTAMEMLMDEDATLEEKVAVAKNLAQLQQAQVQNERLKLQSRKEQGPVRAALEMLKREVTEQLGSHHPDVAQKIIEIADRVELSQ